MSGAYIAKTLMLGNGCGQMSFDADGDDGVWFRWQIGAATVCKYLKPEYARSMAAALLAAADAAEAAKVPA